MKVTLLFPPATDPRAPHLALPALTASLRQSGIEVTQIDLDVEGLHAVLDAERLGAAIRRLHSRPGEHVTPALRQSLLSLSNDLVPRVQQALRTIRDGSLFYDANALSSARTTIDIAVAVVSSAAAIPLAYSLEPIRYDVGGFDTRRLGDLIRVTGHHQSNLFHEFWEEDVLPRVDLGEPTLVGVSMANRQQLIPGLTLARRLKERGHYVVLGGTLISKYADNLTQWPEFFETFADGVVVFEGETALVELVNQLERRRDFKQVPNFRYLDGGSVRATTTHIEDIDALPTPDFAGLPLGDYLVPRPVLPILFGKGCYHGRCAFCDIPHINRVSRSRSRRRSPQKVAADLRRLEAQFAARHFVITDESLSADALCDVADALGTEQQSYSFAGYARLDADFSPEVCRRIAALGVRKLCFGLESASQRTLDHMGKGTEASVAPAVLRACQEAGINFHIFTMIGLPEEDEVSARETFDFLVDNHDIINHPGNSFDIHRFGLDVRARYFADRDRLGLRVDPEVVAQDLVISLSHHDWHNTRGLSPDRTGELLDEFNRELSRRYALFHNAPRHLWPPFEEHAVLYGDHYLGRPFPYASALPKEAKGSRFELRLSPACRVQINNGNAVLSSFWCTVELPASLIRAITDPRPRTMDELVAECVSVSPEQAPRARHLLRDLIRDLLGKGVLQLELSQASSRPSDKAEPRCPA